MEPAPRVLLGAAGLKIRRDNAHPCPLPNATEHIITLGGLFTYREERTSVPNEGIAIVHFPLACLQIQPGGNEFGAPTLIRRRQI